ncbi:MAG: hypothetical protein HQK91_13685 [Nitrospirae bacterium]|nr:hypothetical protein [Nitrospirota bacterium]MBF0542488.1 hypothetical protein [Nitrospirota bacterium]
MNESNSCSPDKRCESGIVKNILKMGILLLLGISLFIYMILLFTGAIGEKKNVAQITASPAEIESAKNALDNVASDPIVKAVKEVGSTLTITVNLEKWKKLERKDKKEFLQKLGKSRSTLGLNPSIKVIDDRSVEHASFEHNRLSIGDFDF